MANICENNLVLKGKRDVLLPLVDLLRPQPRRIKSIEQEYLRVANALLLALYPIPKEVSSSNGWRLTNWGCSRGYPEKIRYSYSDLESIDGSPPVQADIATMEIDFDTAWSPPIGAVAHFCETNRVYGKLMYYEGLEAFCGSAEFYHDELGRFRRLEFSVDLPEDKDDLEIPQELDEFFGISENCYEEEE